MPDKSYLFEDNVNRDYFKTLLGNSKPKFITKIKFEKVTSDFNSGDFSFFISYGGKTFEIPFDRGDYNINNLWTILEKLTSSTKPLIFHIFRFGFEYILYFEPLEDNKLRFCVMDCVELYKMQLDKKILRFSYLDFNIDIDIIMNKKKFLSQFYKKLFEIFDSYKNIAYFEPPLIDFDFWIKDSTVIKEFIKKKTKAKNKINLAPYSAF